MTTSNVSANSPITLVQQWDLGNDKKVEIFRSKDHLLVTRKFDKIIREPLKPPPNQTIEDFVKEISKQQAIINEDGSVSFLKEKITTDWTIIHEWDLGNDKKGQVFRSGNALELRAKFNKIIRKSLNPPPNQTIEDFVKEISNQQAIINEDGSVSFSKEKSKLCDVPKDEQNTSDWTIIHEWDCGEGKRARILRFKDQPSETKSPTSSFQTESKAHKTYTYTLMPLGQTIEDFVKDISKQQVIINEDGSVSFIKEKSKLNDVPKEEQNTSDYDIIQEWDCGEGKIARILWSKDLLEKGSPTSFQTESKAYQTYTQPLSLEDPIEVEVENMRKIHEHRQVYIDEEKNVVDFLIKAREKSKLKDVTIDELNWGVTIVDLGQCKLTDILTFGGHAGVIIEAIIEGQYEVIKAHLVMNTEGLKEGRCGMMEALLKSAERLAEVKTYKISLENLPKNCSKSETWVRPKSLVEKMIRQIEWEASRSKEKKSIGFEGELPIMFSAMGVRGVASRRLNCLGWARKIVYLANIYVPLLYSPDFQTPRAYFGTRTQAFIQRTLRFGPFLGAWLGSLGLYIQSALWRSEGRFILLVGSYLAFMSAKYLNPYGVNKNVYASNYYERRMGEKSFLKYFKKRVENPQYRHPGRGGTEIPNTLRDSLIDQVNKMSPRPHAPFELKLRFEKHFCYLDVLKDGKIISSVGRFRHFDEHKWSIALCDGNQYETCCLKDERWFCSFKEAIWATEDLRKLGFVQYPLNRSRNLIMDSLRHLFFSWLEFITFYSRKRTKILG
jgi:hypothetical protein